MGRGHCLLQGGRVGNLRREFGTDALVANGVGASRLIRVFSLDSLRGVCYRSLAM